MIFTLLLLMAAETATPETDVMAQVKAGNILCINANPVVKTCSAAYSFEIASDGSIIEVGEVLIPADQALTLEISSIVQIQRSTICGAMVEADLRKGRIRLNGELLPTDRNAAMLDRLAERFRPLFGRQTCEVLRVHGGRLLKFGQVENVDIALPGKPVQWVLPNDGYKVAPS